MYARYRDRFDFYAVYIKEAHPADGWRMESNDRAGIEVAQPRSAEERCRAAGLCSSALEISMPLLVDAISNDVEEAYAAFPDRLYLIGRDGRVAYKGGRGPFGYSPRELEQAMALMVVEETLRAF